MILNNYHTISRIKELYPEPLTPELVIHLTLQELWHGTLSTDATHSEQAGLMARRAASMTHAAGFSAS